jgi:hypothetical protein
MIKHMIGCDRMLSHAIRRRFNPAPLSRNLRTSARTTMKVIPVPVRSDNYAYLLVDEESKSAAAVDPYDLPKVVSSAQGLGVEIVACITTHHHDDHSGGNHVCEIIYFLPMNFADTVSPSSSYSYVPLIGHRRPLSHSYRQPSSPMHPSTEVASKSKL